MSAMRRLILLGLTLGLILWASTAVAQKDKMHMGEALGATITRPGQPAPKPNDPDPLHAQPGTKAISGEMKPQRVPTFNDPNRGVQGN